MRDERRHASRRGVGRTLDLAVVRVRRAGAAGSASPHVILAGGPGDSGVNQALGLARQGGALFANLVNGDVIGIDQCGTGRSLPNLSSSPVHALSCRSAWLTRGLAAHRRALVGDLDPRTPVENARAIASTLPDGRVVVLENAGHQFDLFGAAPVREVLERFLRGERPTVERLSLPPVAFT